MSKDLTYYRLLPYEREWLPRDDESGRYFVVRLKDIPEIYGMGDTKQEALTRLWGAFDDQITWCLEEGVGIPEPSVVRRSKPRTVEIIVERIPAGRGRLRVQRLEDEAVTVAGGSSESYTSEPVNVSELEEVAV